MVKSDNFPNKYNINLANQTNYPHKWSVNIFCLSVAFEILANTFDRYCVQNENKYSHSAYGWWFSTATNPSHSIYENMSMQSFPGHKLNGIYWMWNWNRFVHTVKQTVLCKRVRKTKQN